MYIFGYIYILYIIIWVFLYRTSQSVSSLAWRLGPIRTATGRYKVRYKNTHMIIILSLMYMYCDLYWQPKNIWIKVITCLLALFNTTSKGLSGCRNGLKMLFYYNNIFIRSYLVHNTVKYCFIQTGLGFSLSKTKFLAWSVSLQIKKIILINNICYRFCIKHHMGKVILYLMIKSSL